MPSCQIVLASHCPLQSLARHKHQVRHFHNGDAAAQMRHHTPHGRLTLSDTHHNVRMWILFSKLLVIDAGPIAADHEITWLMFYREFENAIQNTLCNFSLPRFYRHTHNVEPFVSNRPQDLVDGDTGLLHVEHRDSHRIPELSDQVAGQGLDVHWESDSRMPFGIEEIDKKNRESFCSFFHSGCSFLWLIFEGCGLSFELSFE